MLVALIVVTHGLAVVFLVKCLCRCAYIEECMTRQIEIKNVVWESLSLIYIEYQGW
jgi:intracellular septation protein A